MIGCLENAIYWQPGHASAHLALAEAHLRLFDKLQANSPNPMTLMDIRNAALASDFSSPQALHEWLARALGDNWLHLEAALRHTGLALSLCPLQGRGYVYLAKLGFLEGKKSLSKQACIEQALCVRPFDGSVVSAAAAEALLDGNTQRWLDLCKQGFRCGRGYQRELMHNLVANVPPEGIQGMVDFIITQFQPDLEGLQSLYEACSKRAGADLLEPLCHYRAQRAEYEARNRNGPDALDLWLEAQRLHTQLNDGPQALQCAFALWSATTMITARITNSPRACWSRDYLPRRKSNCTGAGKGPQATRRWKSSLNRPSKAGSTPSACAAAPKGEKL